MIRVFISYRRQVSYPYAEQLRNILVRAGLNANDIFLDKHSLDNGSFSAQINHAIKDSENFVVLLDKDALTRQVPTDYFFNELQQAIDDKVNIVPMFFLGFNKPANTDPVSETILGREGVEDVSSNYFEEAAVSLIAKFADKEEALKLSRSLKMQNLSIINKRENIERDTLGERWKDAKEIRIMAMAAYNLLMQGSPTIQDFLDRGGIFKLVINTPESLAVDDAVKFKIGDAFGENIRYFFSMSEHIIKPYLKKYPKQFFYHVTDMYLPFAIQEIICDDEANNRIKVDYYGFNTANKDERSVVVPFDDVDNYKYYREQFETVWDNPKFSREPKIL